MYALYTILAFTVQFTVGSVRFAHIGDWGVASDEGLGKTMSSIKRDPSIKFLVLGGDNFYETGVTDVRDSQFNDTYSKFFESIAPSMPRFVILGNHDYFGNAMAQVLYSQYDKTWTSPYYYYHKQILIDGVDICAVFIDTYNINQSGQMGFLHTALGAPDCQSSDAIFVFGHHPLYSAGGHGDSVILQNILEDDVLVKYNVDAYIAGHDHLLSLHLNKGVAHVVSGAAGKKTTSSWYTSTSKAENTVFSSYGQFGYAKFSVSGTGSTTIEIWNSETDVIMFSYEIMSKKQVRQSTAPPAFESRYITGSRAWSELNVYGMSIMLILTWILFAIAIQPGKISLAIK